MQKKKKTTDEKLVLLAKNEGSELFTTDFNLNQVANIEGVRVLNINELSHAIRPVALPGEDFEIKVVQASSNRDQGVCQKMALWLLSITRAVTFDHTG